MPAWLLVLLICLATHRLSRLLTRDEIPIVKVPREALLTFLDPTQQDVAAGRASVRKRSRAEKSIAYLLTCDWCMSAYAGGGIVLATALTIGLPAPLLVWGAASTVTGLIASWEGEHDLRWETMDLELQRRKAEQAARR